MADDVTIKDGGLDETLKGLYALHGSEVKVGVFGASRDERGRFVSVKHYAQIQEAKTGWKSIADDELHAHLDERVEQAHNEAVKGGGAVEAPLERFGEWAQGVMVKTITRLGLVDTGALKNSIQAKVKLK